MIPKQENRFSTDYDGKGMREGSESINGGVIEEKILASFYFLN